jgi:hypothetical protein
MKLQIPLAWRRITARARKLLAAAADQRLRQYGLSTEDDGDCVEMTFQLWQGG